MFIVDIIRRFVTPPGRADLHGRGELRQRGPPRPRHPPGPPPSVPHPALTFVPPPIPSPPPPPPPLALHQVTK